MIEISKAELEVMQVVWKDSPCKSSDIVEALSNQNGRHEKTVKTLINRLVKKGALDFKKDGRSYLYYPLIEKQAYQQSVGNSVLDRLFGGRLTPFIANFAAQKKLSKDDINELKSLIDKWEQEND